MNSGQASFSYNASATSCTLACVVNSGQASFSYNEPVCVDELAHVVNSGQASFSYNRRAPERGHDVAEG